MRWKKCSADKYLYYHILDISIKKKNKHYVQVAK